MGLSFRYYRASFLSFVAFREWCLEWQSLGAKSMNYFTYHIVLTIGEIYDILEEDGQYILGARQDFAARYMRWRSPDANDDVAAAAADVVVAAGVVGDFISDEIMMMQAWVKYQQETGEQVRDWHPLLKAMPARQKKTAMDLEMCWQTLQMPMNAFLLHSLEMVDQCQAKQGWDGMGWGYRPTPQTMTEMSSSDFVPACFIAALFVCQVACCEDWGRPLLSPEDRC
jgi:hypothetical protein